MVRIQLHTDVFEKLRKTSPASQHQAILELSQGSLPARVNRPPTALHQNLTQDLDIMPFPQTSHSHGAHCVSWGKPLQPQPESYNIIGRVPFFVFFPLPANTAATLHAENATMLFIKSLCTYNDCKSLSHFPVNKTDPRPSALPFYCHKPFRMFILCSLWQIIIN